MDITLTRDPRIERALELIESRLHERLSNATLAQTAGLSVTQLTRLFRRTVGTTPGAYLHACRMSRARTLVERTSLPVADIMRLVGISDRSHFARDFQRVHGFSPRTLRVQLRYSGRSLPSAVRVMNR